MGSDAWKYRALADFMDREKQSDPDTQDVKYERKFCSYGMEFVDFVKKGYGTFECTKCGRWEYQGREDNPKSVMGLHDTGTKVNESKAKEDHSRPHTNKWGRHVSWTCPICGDEFGIAGHGGEGERFAHMQEHEKKGEEALDSTTFEEQEHPRDSDGKFTAGSGNAEMQSAQRMMAEKPEGDGLDYDPTHRYPPEISTLLKMGKDRQKQKTSKNPPMEALSYTSALKTYAKFLKSTKEKAYSFNPKTGKGFDAFNDRDAAKDFWQQHSNGKDPVYVVGITNHQGDLDRETESAYDQAQQYGEPLIGHWESDDTGFAYTDISYPVNHGTDDIEAGKLGKNHEQESVLKITPDGMATLIDEKGRVSEVELKKYPNDFAQFITNKTLTIPQIILCLQASFLHHDALPDEIRKDVDDYQANILKNKKVDDKTMPNKELVDTMQTVDTNDTVESKATEATNLNTFDFEDIEDGEIIDETPLKGVEYTLESKKPKIRLKESKCKCENFGDFVDIQMGCLKLKAKEGQSYSLLYDQPQVEGRKIKGTLAYAGVSLNNRLYLPEELQKGDGMTVPLILNHASTAGAEGELYRLPEKFRNGLDKGLEMKVGEVKLNWQPDELTLYYEGTVDDEFFIKEIDDADMAVSLGLYYDSDSPQICDRECYTMIKGAEFHEVSLVYHAGFPIATIEAVESFVRNNGKKALEFSRTEDPLVEKKDLKEINWSG